MIYSINDIKTSIDSLRDKGVQRGDNTGFSCLDELYSVKPGTYSIFLGAPTHGKSEIIFEVLLNQAIHYGKKAIILSPETGNSMEITLELIHKYSGKSAYKSNPFSLTDSEYEKAFNWVAYNFSIADDEEKSYSFKELTDEITIYEKRNGIKYQNIMAEPWNELNHKLALNDNSGRQDLAIEDELTQLRRYCKKEDKHAFLSFHPSFQTLVKDPRSGISYYEMPKAREAAGGQATLRKAFSWINIWRPPVGLIDPETSMPFQDNEVIIQVEKSKPKGVGKKGMCRLFFDWRKNRYYEQVDGANKFAFDHTKNHNIHTPIDISIKPSSLF